LRKAGWQADSKTLRFAKGARPEAGVNKAIAEWPTGKDETGNPGFADYVLFVGLKPIAVIEAKRKNTDVPASSPSRIATVNTSITPSCAIRCWNITRPMKYMKRYRNMKSAGRTPAAHSALKSPSATPPTGANTARR
jgi:hypothetical protein